MTARESGPSTAWHGASRIGAGIAAMVVVIAGIQWLVSGNAAAAARQLPARAPARVGDPISEEALVFRTRPGVLAVDTGAIRHPEAHPRTLATFRGLRAYPGAPPRIPHGLTTDEYRSGECRTCHARGGYSLRFGAYVPVTPHPEMPDCLSCHVPDDVMVGIALPARRPEGDCRQCHAPTARVQALVALDWRPAAWPAAIRRLPDGSPPPIPHDVALRGDCNACHMGPAAVAEIRTDHPERADCRGCHLVQEDVVDGMVRSEGKP